jgi:hypothetical protein
MERGFLETGDNAETVYFVSVVEYYSASVVVAYYPVYVVT